MLSTVFIAPYGEALIHPWYWEALARLTLASSMQAAGCQTNLSFAVKEMLCTFYSCGGEIQKLRLWCTFHPSMTSVDHFATQCELLMEENISFCVGAVGDPGELTHILQLRRRLPHSVYLWINPMDGLDRSYEKEEIEAFSQIDPWFLPGLNGFCADWPGSRCSCGKDTLFLNDRGDLFLCNRNRRRVGNLYQKSLALPEERFCSAPRCDCYLAYCNRSEWEALMPYDIHPCFRIPLSDGLVQTRDKIKNW